jgi:hypothetical protein
MDIVKGAELLAKLIAERGGHPAATMPQPTEEGVPPVFGWTGVGAAAAKDELDQ